MEIASVNIFAAFFFGALSFLSPCVLPLLPGYLSMMSGYSAAEMSEVNDRRPAATLLSTSESSPGSKIGIFPARSASIFSGTLSTQTTFTPNSEKQAAETRPT